MSNYSNASVLRIPGFRKYIGSASNLSNGECRLAAGSNSGGMYLVQNDIAPNFSILFEARCPRWSTNQWSFGMHCDAQSVYYVAPSNNLLQFCDKNKTPLQSFTLHSNGLLSNNVFNSFKLVNNGSNLIMVVNGYPYTSKVPNWNYVANNWDNSSWSWSACNSGTVTGSNSIRRLFMQSHCTFTDPVILNNSLTAQVANAAKMGTTELLSRVVDSQVIFSDHLFSSNVFCMSNLLASNCSLSNCIVRTSFTCSNFTASGAIASSSGTFVNLTASNTRTSNLSVLNPALTQNTAALEILVGKSDSTLNAGVIRYVHEADGGGTGPFNAVHLGFRGMTATPLSILANGNVGVNSPLPGYNFEVTGTSRLLGTTTLQGPTLQRDNMWMYDNRLYLRTNTDTSNYVAYSSAATGVDVVGVQGGRLGTSVGGVFTPSLFWTNPNRVGINNSNPIVNLDVSGPARITGPLNIAPTGAATCQLVLYSPTSTPSLSDTLYYGFAANNSQLQYRVDNTGASHVFYGGTTEVARIRGNGTVGIGTTNPSSSFKLDVNGNTRTTGDATITGNATVSGIAQCGTVFIPDGGVFKVGTGGTPFSMLWAYVADVNTVATGPVTIGVNLGFSMLQQYHIFTQIRDLMTPLVTDQYVAKVTQQTTTSFQVLISRLDTGSSSAGWGRAFKVVMFMIGL